MAKPHRQRGFWAEAWPLAPRLMVASVADRRGSLSTTKINERVQLVGHGNR